MKETETKILDRFGKPIQQKAIDTRQLLGIDLGNYGDVWQKQRKPDRAKLVKEYKSTAYACANLNTQAVVKTDIKLYRKTANGEKSRWPVKSLTYSQQKEVADTHRIKTPNGQKIEEVVEHPLLDLLNRPNQWADLVGLIEFTQLFQEIVGAAYWYVVRNQLGTPFELYLLCPQYLKTICDDSGRVIRYEYGRGSGRAIYDADEVIPFLLPNPSNPWQDGMSPLASVFDAINIEDKLSATTAAILDNEGRPAGILAAKEGIGPDEAARWEYKFNQKFRKAGSGGVIVLDEDASFSPLTFSPRDLSWLAIHDTSRLAICNAYGVPYALIDKNGSTQYNVDVTLKQRHVEDAIIPRLRRNQSVLNRYLVPLFDDSGKLFLAFDDPSPTNRELKLKEDTELVKAGIKTQNEVRLERGLDVHVDGHRLSVPAGASYQEQTPDDSTAADELEALPESETLPNPKMTLNGSQIQSATAIVTAVATGQLPRDSGIGSLMVLLNLSKEQAESIMGSVGRGFEPEPPPTAQPPLKSCNCGHCSPKRPARRKTKGPKMPPAKALSDVLKAHFKRCRADVVRSLAKGKAVKALPSAFVPMKSWDAQLYKEAQPVIELWIKDNYTATGQDLVAQAGISAEVFDVTNPNLEKMINDLALAFCEETNKTTTQDLNDALAQLKDEIAAGLLDGDRMSDLSDAVNGVFDEAEEYRAERIAATEASRSHHQAAIAAAKDSGVVSGCKILPSSGCCELCQQIADDMGEVELGGVFYKDESAPDAYQDKDGPPLHPNCECTLEFVLMDQEGETATDEAN